LGMCRVPSRVQRVTVRVRSRSPIGGTLFLDEVGELPLHLQPRLLRVLKRREIKRVGENKYRRVNVRVIAATHHNLKHAVKEGLFRADLYYRLAVVECHVPPLRERIEDLGLLIDGMLRLIAGATGWSVTEPDAPTLERWRRYSWPGNVRELRNTLERYAVHGDGHVSLTGNRSFTNGHA